MLDHALRQRARRWAGRAGQNRAATRRSLASEGVKAEAFVGIGMMEVAAVVRVVLLAGERIASHRCNFCTHLGHFAAGSPGPLRTVVGKDRTAATCVLTHLPRAEGGCVAVGECAGGGGGGRWSGHALQELPGALARASREEEAREELNRSCPACRRASKDPASLGVKRSKGLEEAAIEWHDASSSLQQREQRARETARQQDAAPNTPATGVSCRRVTKQFSPREGMTLQRAACFAHAQVLAAPYLARRKVKADVLPQHAPAARELCCHAARAS
jgi:hypothetical protein